MKWKAAYRSLDELDPAWYRSFDAGNPNHIMAALDFIDHWHACRAEQQKGNDNA